MKKSLINSSVDNLLEYKCTSKKHNKKISIKCNLLHKQVELYVNKVFYYLNV